MKKMNTLNKMELSFKDMRDVSGGTGPLNYPYKETGPLNYPDKETGPLNYPYKETGPLNYPY